MDGITLICRPENDQPFRAFVELQVRDLPPNATGLDLEARLHSVYPWAVVRPSSRLGSISGGPTVRYAYRDGGETPDGDREWWCEPGVAMAAFDTDHVCREVNDAALDLFGVSASGDVVGHAWSEFGTPEAVAAAEPRWTELTLSGAAGEPIQSTYSLIRSDGRPFPIEYRTAFDPATGLCRTALRPAPVDGVEPPRELESRSA